MADLTEAGLLFAPHTSAGRLPTDRGLRLFVDGLLNFGELAEEDREAISAALAATGRSLEDTLAEARSLLSGLSAGAGAGAGAEIGGRRSGTSSSCRLAPGARWSMLVERRRAGGEPGDRDAARPAAVGAAAGRATT